MTTTREFNDEDLSKELGKFQSQAEEILNNETKFAKFISRAEKWLSKFKDKPVIGDIIDDLITTLQLLNDYKEGNYRKIPVRVIIATIAAILYIISPIDLIPDWIPVVGLLDDIAVFGLVMKLGLSSELKKYRNWRADKNIDEILNDAETDNDNIYEYDY